MTRAEKSVLRARARTARAALARTIRAERSAAIAGHLLGLPELVAVTHVLGYAPFGTEADVGECLATLRRRGVDIALPWVDGDDLGVSAVREYPEGLAPGWSGVLEPVDRTPVDLGVLDAVLVPGLAFDRSGVRLGYGGGHFDRLLARLRPEVPRIGVAFADQLVERLPVEPHDQPVTVVVTEVGVVRP